MKVPVLLPKIFNYPFSELNALWIGTKLYEIVKNEQEGLNALKVAEQQLSYEKTENARN